ncbi:hypothetical protein MG293_011581 [Ovis ammon polii]|uniref:Uncharacterized protein n=1 Tax=Ovis ammon polii TaxID=230172 RepID=A0AAD4U2A2_OVIAM|nr:hypothetical protein MG293_011581 [Ovis ammon polii]
MLEKTLKQRGKACGPCSGGTPSPQGQEVMEIASEDARRERGEWAGGTRTPEGQLRVRDRLACAVLATQLGPPHLPQPGAGLLARAAGTMDDGCGVGVRSLSPDARKQLRLQESQEAFSETLQRVPQPALIRPQVPAALLPLPVICGTSGRRGNREP